MWYSYIYYEHCHIGYSRYIRISTSKKVVNNLISWYIRIIYIQKYIRRVDIIKDIFKNNFKSHVIFRWFLWTSVNGRESGHLVVHILVFLRQFKNLMCIVEHPKTRTDILEERYIQKKIYLKQKYLEKDITKKEYIQRRIYRKKIYLNSIYF